MNVTVLGAGSWGTTVAALSAGRNPTTLWARDDDVAREVAVSHTNSRYLAGFPLPERLAGTSDLEEAVSAADVLVVGVPSHGFRAVLDMRTEAEGHDAARERALVEAAGMRYLSLPVSSEAPRPEQIAEFTRAVKDAGNHPLFVHCASGNRVGAFWLAYRVVEDGWAVERALEEAERVGLRSEKLKRFALDYVESRRPVN